MNLEKRELFSQQTPVVEITQLDSSPAKHRIRKQDSYLRAVDGLSPEDELAPLPR